VRRLSATVGNQRPFRIMRRNLIERGEAMELDPSIRLTGFSHGAG
jgi:hypothetical protein